MKDLEQKFPQAKFVTATADPVLENEQDLGALTTGLLKITVAGGEATTSTATPGVDYITSAGDWTATDAITAYATGGQANAVELTTDINRVTVCATEGDSCKLEAVFGTGINRVIINNGATAMDLFPASGDTLNGLGANIAIQVLPGHRVWLQSIVANSEWVIIG